MIRMTRVAHEVSSIGNRYDIFEGFGRGLNHNALARSRSVTGVERDCVLRRLFSAYDAHDELVQMFLDNARLVAQLQHPNIEAVYDFGTLGGILRGKITHLSPEQCCGAPV